MLIGQPDRQEVACPSDVLAAERRPRREERAPTACPTICGRSKGFLQTTDGNSIKYEDVAKILRDLFNRYNIRKLAFDRWNMAHLKPWLEKAGFSINMIEDRFVEFGQGTQSMSPALRSLEELLRDKLIVHGNHPVLAMCAACAVVEGKDDANRKLSKNKLRPDRRPGRAGDGGRRRAADAAGGYQYAGRVMTYKPLIDIVVTPKVMQALIDSGRVKWPQRHDKFTVGLAVSELLHDIATGKEVGPYFRNPRRDQSS